MRLMVHPKIDFDSLILEPDIKHNITYPVAEFYFYSAWTFASVLVYLHDGDYVIGVECNVGFSRILYG